MLTATISESTNHLLVQIKINQIKFYITGVVINILFTVTPSAYK